MGGLTEIHGYFDEVNTKGRSQSHGHDRFSGNFLNSVSGDG